MGTILLAGSDIYSLDNRLREIIKQSGQHHVYFADEIADINSIPELIGGLSLFSDVQTVVLRNPISAGSKELQDSLIDLLPKLSENVSLIMVETTAPDKRLKLYKYLAKHQLIQEFPEPSNREKHEIISKILADSKVSASATLIEKVYFALLHQNTGVIRSELQKLIMLASSREPKVMLETDLEALTTNKQEEVWKLVTVATRNKSEAQKLLVQLLFQGEDPQKLIGFISYQLRQLISYYYNIGSLNPYQKRDIAELARAVPVGKLKILVQKLADLDIASKTGKVDPVIGLHLYLNIL